MSKEKTIIYMLAIGLLLTVLIFTENTQESVAVENTSAIVRENIAPKTVQVEEVLLDKAQNIESTKISEKVDRNTPKVERSKLIGGADVVWIEPKAKDPNNPFGKPPL